MHTIDVYILTGFVGAGKTTTLNQLLCGEFANADPALIINEFGKIGVDGTLVERRDLVRYEINKGSIFCICTKTDFLKALDEIAGSSRHKTVLIEATGIAETADIESFIEGGPCAESFRVAANICLVDAANFTRTAAFLKPALTQAQCADLIVINKTDLVGEHELNRLQKILKELNADAPIIPTQYGKMPSGCLRNVRHVRRGDMVFEEPPANIVAVSFDNAGVFDRMRFYETLKTLEDHLLRVKGHVLFADGLRFVELAGTVLRESDPAAGYSGSTAFTAIAWKTDRQALIDEFLRSLSAPITDI